MGATYVTVTVSNPMEPERKWTGEFLADTGATVSIVPRCHLKKIGIAPDSSQLAELADGSVIRFDMGTAGLNFIDTNTAGTVLFGSDDAEPLLGVAAMQSVGVKVDTVNHCLERVKFRA